MGKNTMGKNYDKKKLPWGKLTGQNGTQKNYNGKKLPHEELPQKEITTR